MNLYGRVFVTALFESVCGDIALETEILEDGTFHKVLWIIYPDGSRDQVFNVNDGFAKLEL